MTTKRYLTFILLPFFVALAAAAILALVVPPGHRSAGMVGGKALPTKDDAANSLPAEAGTASAEPTLAAQKARLALSDGRTATFAFVATAGTLTAHAAVGLDQECNYVLLPLSDLLLPTPRPDPTPGPAPDPQPVPKPQPSNLRVLFTYDPATLADLAPPRQAILASPELRSYLEKHCPLESNCPNGMCPINAEHVATGKAAEKGTVPFSLERKSGQSPQESGQSPSYRFLPAAADVAALPAVWQGIFRAARGRPAPWLLVVNEAGQTVVDQPWPESVDATLALLKKYGGE